MNHRVSKTQARLLSELAPSERIENDSRIQAYYVRHDFQLAPKRTSDNSSMFANYPKRIGVMGRTDFIQSEAHELES